MTHTHDTHTHQNKQISLLDNLCPRQSIITKNYLEKVPPQPDTIHSAQCGGLHHAAHPDTKLGIIPRYLSARQPGKHWRKAFLHTVKCANVSSDLDLIEVLQLSGQLTSGDMECADGPRSGSQRNFYPFFQG